MSSEQEQQGREHDNMNLYCPRCQEPRELCHSKQFRRYCIDALNHQFRETPLSMNRKKCSKVFTDAYNRAFDYCMFQIQQKLVPNAYHYTPAYLKTDLHDYICTVEEEVDDHISGTLEYASHDIVDSKVDIKEHIKK